MAALPRSPSRAVRVTLSSRGANPGASVSTLRGEVEAVFALGDTSSIGDSFVELLRLLTAGRKSS
jgi:hypothetical protein